MTDNNNTSNDTAMAPAGASPDHTGSPVLPAQAESIAESYIAARVVRSRRALTIAKVALLRDPRNTDKREALRRVEAETNELQAQLLGQVRKASQARAHAKGATVTAAAATPAAPFFSDDEIVALRTGATEPTK